MTRPREELEASVRRLTAELAMGHAPCGSMCVGNPCPIGRLKTSSSCYDSNGREARDDAFYAECWRRWSLMPADGRG